MSFSDLFCGNKCPLGTYFVWLCKYFYHLQQSNNIIALFCWKLSDSFLTFFFECCLFCFYKTNKIPFHSLLIWILVGVCLMLLLLFFWSKTHWLLCSLNSSFGCVVLSVRIESSKGLMPFHVRIPAKCHPQWEAFPDLLASALIKSSQSFTTLCDSWCHPVY